MTFPATANAVDFFESVIRSDLSVEVTCDRVSDYLGCPVACEDRQGIRIESGPVADGASSLTLVSGETVWIGGPPRSPVDRVSPELLLEQFAVVVKLAVARRRFSSTVVAAVQTALGSGSSEERADALGTLGLSPDGPVRCVCIAGPDAGRGKLVEEIRQRTEGKAYPARIGRVTAVLVAGDASLDHLSVPVGNHLGRGGFRPARSAPQSWQQARSALRFTQPATRAGRDHTTEEAVQLRYEVIAAYAPLAEAWAGERIAVLPDVRALDELIYREGADMLRTVDVVAATDSFREAARQLRSHHSTVASRVARAERALGFSFSANYGRSRLMLALMMRRLWISAELV